MSTHRSPPKPSLTLTNLALPYVNFSNLSKPKLQSYKPEYFMTALTAI